NGWREIAGTLGNRSRFRRRQKEGKGQSCHTIARKKGLPGRKLHKGCSRPRARRKPYMKRNSSNTQNAQTVISISPRACRRHLKRASIFVLAAALSAFADAPPDRHHEAYGPLYKASPYLDASPRHGPGYGLDTVRR